MPDDPYASFLETYTREQPAAAPTRTDKPREGEHRNLWVWIEHVDGEVYPASLENLGKARELADQLGARCAAVFFGHNIRAAAERLGPLGADQVFVADAPALQEFRLDAYRDHLVALVREWRPESLLFPATVMGRNLAAQVAAALGVGLVPNCVRLEVDAQERRIRHFQTSFEERLLSEIVINDRPQVATVTPGSFRRPAKDPSLSARLMEVASLPPTAPQVRVLKREAPLDRTLESADAIVVGGFGLGSRESFRLAEELSLLLGGHVGATKGAVACGWCDPRTLITSARHRLRPRLYVACGVIGEYDHLKAIEDASQIVAITPDPNAPIAEGADLIGIGEPTAILSEMVETLRSARQDRFLVA